MRNAPRAYGLFRARSLYHLEVNWTKEDNVGSLHVQVNRQAWNDPRTVGNCLLEVLSHIGVVCPLFCIKMSWYYPHWIRQWEHCRGRNANGISRKDYCNKRHKTNKQTTTKQKRAFQQLPPSVSVSVCLSVGLCVSVRVSLPPNNKLKLMCIPTTLSLSSSSFANIISRVNYTFQMRVHTRNNRIFSTNVQ